MCSGSRVANGDWVSGLRQRLKMETRATILRNVGKHWPITAMHPHETRILKNSSGRTWNLEQCGSLFYLATCLLTPWSRVLLEKLTGSKLVKKFNAFYGTRRFIAAFTSARHLSLPWASSIQSIHPHPTSWRSALILSSNLRLSLPNGLFSSRFPTKTLYTPLLHTRYMPRPSHSSGFYHSNNIGWGLQIIELHIM